MYEMYESDGNGAQIRGSSFSFRCTTLCTVGWDHVAQGHPLACRQVVADYSSLLGLQSWLSCLS